MISDTPADSPIVITREIFDHLPVSVRVDAWILKRAGRLVIVEEPRAKVAA